MRTATRLGGAARLTRTVLAVAAVLASMSLFATGARATAITGMMLYNSSDAQGGDYASGGWEAPCTGIIGTMSVSQGVTQYGPCAPFSIDVSTPGVYNLSYATDRPLSVNYADLELFFDGTSVPGITVVINSQDQTVLLPPTTSNRYCPGYAGCTATGGLQFVDGGITVTATEFTVQSGAYWTGDISLDVTGNVPEPASMGLVSAGFLAAGLAFTARRKRAR